MPTYFLDTCALKHRYIPSAFSRNVKRLVSDSRWNCYITDLTILEMASTIGVTCREKHWDVNRFDGMEKLFMKDIEKGRLNVREVKMRDVEHARHLIRYAGVVLGKHIKTADALISACCREFALEKKERMVFLTHDKRLYTTLCSLSAFTSPLILRYLGPPPAATRNSP